MRYQLRDAPPHWAVTDGVWAIPLPLTGSPVGYVVVYALRHRDGLLLIDTGYDDENGRQALDMALDQIGFSLDAITGVILTHNHPDHVGMANRIHARTGSWVAIHRLEQPRPERGDAGTFAGQIITSLELAGVPADLFGRMVERTRDISHDVDRLRATRTIFDGDLIEEGGVCLEVLWTPGHSPGHACLLDRERRLLFSGDVVFSRGDVQLGIVTGPTSDPLGDLRRSLLRIRRLDVAIALPGHQGPIDDLPGRVNAALASLTAVSAELAIAAARQPGCTAWELAPALDWGKPWEELRSLGRRFAALKTLAHLRGLTLSAAWRREPGASGQAERYWPPLRAASQTGSSSGSLSRRSRLSTLPDGLRGSSGSS